MRSFYPLIVVGLFLLMTGCGLETEGKGEDTAQTFPAESIGIQGKITQLTLFKEEDREKEPSSKKGNPSDSISNKDDSSTGKVPKEVRGLIMVEGEPGKQGGRDKVRVTIKEDTEIFRQEGEGRKPAALEDLKEGGEVIVHLVGPVAESYPAQGTAGIIVIID